MFQLFSFVNCQTKEVLASTTERYTKLTVFEDIWLVVPYDIAQCKVTAPISMPLAQYYIGDKKNNEIMHGRV